ncbi:hypothetical protein JTB14_010361 [Gonioctena quinquepunctata]|nr:hypothetical protein JTB14_010361 [Gonioctena quinquepunctata]
MDRKEIERLEQMMDEVSTPDTEESSESEAFSADDDIADPKYSSENELTQNSSDDSVSEDIDRDETVSQNDGAPTGHVTENDELSGDEWQDDISDFSFDSSKSGIRFKFQTNSSIIQFLKNVVMNMILTSMDKYSEDLGKTVRSHRRHIRYSTIKPVTMQELKQFLALCILQGYYKFPSIRKMFSMDPLYYCPVFHYKMAGRRFEQLLRIFSCANGQVANPRDTLNKISPLLKKELETFRNAYYPMENLSLNESLSLFRGRLSLRQYIKNKKARYGMKFHSVCPTDGYVLNMQIHSKKN